MNPLVLFNEGKLDEALKAAADSVRSDPSNSGVRAMFAELLCFAGDLERADKQIEAAERIDAGAALPLVQFRQIIHAEAARLDFHESGRMPCFLTEASPEMKIRLEASLFLREGKTAEAQSKLVEAEELRSAVGGDLNGQHFDDLCDGDDLIASVLEVLTTDGRYFWIPLTTIDSIAFEPPKRPRDLLFRQALLSVRSGPEGVVFVPTLYAGSSASERLDIRLARATDWIGKEGQPVRGLGQRVLFAGSKEKAILDIESIEVDSASDDEAAPQDGDS